MGALAYTGLEFHRFWRNPSLESLADYSRNIDRAFKDGFPKVTFSRQQFTRTFESLLDHYNPHSNPTYRFQSEDTDHEIWETKLRLTQIANFEGGLVHCLTEDIDRRLTFARELIAQEVASLVYVDRFVSAKGIRRIFGKTLEGRIVGQAPSIYLWKKVMGNQSLRNKLRWEVFDGTFGFFSFADHVFTLFQPDGDSIVELTFGPDTDQLPAFMKSCDERLNSSLSGSDLNKLFTQIGLSAKEWFDSGISGRVCG